MAEYTQEQAQAMYEALKRITTELEYVHVVASDDRAFTPSNRSMFASSEGAEAIKQARAALKKAVPHGNS